MACLQSFTATLLTTLNEWYSFLLLRGFPKNYNPRYAGHESVKNPLWEDMSHTRFEDLETHFLSALVHQACVYYHSCT
jgi:hypothetical protein